MKLKDHISIKQEESKPEVIKSHPSIQRWMLGAIWRFVQSWDRTVEHMAEGASKRCHLQLVRLAKGMLKAIRVYMIETNQEKEVE